MPWDIPGYAMAIPDNPGYSNTDQSTLLTCRGTLIHSYFDVKVFTWSGIERVNSFLLNQRSDGTLTDGTTRCYDDITGYGTCVLCI